MENKNLINELSGNEKVTEQKVEIIEQDLSADVMKERNMKKDRKSVV